MKGYSVVMSSTVASIIQNGLFGTRNSLLGTGIMAPEQNNQVRLLVSAGQAENLLKAGQKCNNSVFKNISTKAINVCDDIAKNDKVFGKIFKVVDFASKNVNNLIVVASGVKVLTAEDKQSELLAQTGNIAGMFAVEGWMKKNLAKYVAKLPINSKMKPVIEGILFVLGSITGSTICYNIGKKVAAKIKKSNEEYKAQQEQNNLPKSIAINA